MPVPVRLKHLLLYFCGHRPIKSLQLVKSSHPLPLRATTLPSVFASLPLRPACAAERLTLPPAHHPLSTSAICLATDDRARKMADDIPQTEEGWRLKLTPEQFRILRKKGTEMAGSGELNKHKADQGVYQCAGCNAPLYRYDHKFDSGCGWPAFFDSFPGAVSRQEDRMFGQVRTEIICTNCGGHLGHVFKGEGFGHPTDERHCVNSVSIKFNDKISADEPKSKA